MKSILVTLVLFSFLVLGCSAEEKPTSVSKQNIETPPNLDSSVSPASELSKTEKMEKLEEKIVNITEKININKTIEEINQTEQVNANTNNQQDPVLTQLSQRLKIKGVDCSFENEHKTQNSLAIDPNDSNIIYIGVEGKGVFKSANKGSSWKKITNGILAYPDINNLNELCYIDMAQIVIDQTNTQHLFLVPADVSSGYIDWPYAEIAGIWESLNGGESWHQFLSNGINAAGTGALAIDSNNTQIVYYPVSGDSPSFIEAPIKKSLSKNGTLYKTIDGGDNWEELAIGMIPGLQVVAIFIDQSNSNNIILLTQSHDHSYINGVTTDIFLYEQFGPMKSTDSGRSWTMLANNLPSPYRAIFDGDVAKNNFGHIIARPFVFGPDFPSESTKQKSFYSIDGGQTFQETPIYIHVGRYDPHDLTGNHLLGYSPWQGGIIESNDAGATWKAIGEVPSEVERYNVAISNFVWDPQNPDIIYMSGTMGNVWQSIDKGRSWENILNLDKLPK